MPSVICKDGKEVTIRGVIEYLDRRYGIPPAHIRHVAVSATVGEPIIISLELYQQQEDQPAEPAGRKLIGPAWAHADAPCTDRCYEPARTDDLGTPLDAADVGDAETRDRPFCLDHGAGCSGWPRHEGWTPSELDG